MLGEDLVSVVDKIMLPSSIPDNFPQLLQRPVRARMRGHIDVRQAACPVLYDNEHVTSETSP
jgi:hypothetical protein